jgi:hypothetical protein
MWPQTTPYWCYCNQAVSHSLQRAEQTEAASTRLLLLSRSRGWSLAGAVPHGGDRRLPPVPRGNARRHHIHVGAVGGAATGGGPRHPSASTCGRGVPRETSSQNHGRRPDGRGLCEEHRHPAARDHRNRGIPRGRHGRPAFSTGGATTASNTAHEKNGSVGRVGAERSTQDEEG